MYDYLNIGINSVTASVLSEYDKLSTQDASLAENKKILHKALKMPVLSALWRAVREDKKTGNKYTRVSERVWKIAQLKLTAIHDTTKNKTPWGKILLGAVAVPAVIAGAVLGGPAILGAAKGASLALTGASAVKTATDFYPAENEIETEGVTKMASISDWLGAPVVEAVGGFFKPSVKDTTSAPALIKPADTAGLIKLAIIGVLAIVGLSMIFRR